MELKAKWMVGSHGTWSVKGWTASSRYQARLDDEACVNALVGFVHRCLNNEIQDFSNSMTTQPPCEIEA